VVQDGQLIAEVVERSDTGHAAGLPDLVARVLEEAGVVIEALDGLAVSVGPGSFTGLRVGLCFAKGIAFATGARIVAVRTLEALCATAPADFTVVAAVTDARRGETYAAVFERGSRGLRRLMPEASLTPEEAAEAIAPHLAERGACVIVGDGAERYPEAFATLREQSVVIAPFSEIHPRGGAVALLGEARLARGESDAANALVPLYVRASAAERNRLKTSLTTENTVS